MKLGFLQTSQLYKGTSNNERKKTIFIGKPITLAKTIDNFLENS